MTTTPDELVCTLGHVGIANWNRFAAVNDEFVLVHMDDDTARRAGFGGAFAMGNLQWAYVHRALRSWGLESHVERVRLRFLAPAYRGSMLVRARPVHDRQLEVQVEVDGSVTAAGDIFLRPILQARAEETTLADTTTEPELPTVPLPRACPFDPPPLCMANDDVEPIFKVRLWNDSEAWLVTRYDDNRALLTDRRLSSDTLMPGMPHQSEAFAQFRVARNFIGMDAPEHLYYRRKVATDFGPRHMERLRPAVQRIVDQRLDGLIGIGPPAELIAQFALPVTSLVICELLGVPYESHQTFEELSTTLFSNFTSTTDAASVNDQMLTFLGELFDAKRRDPGDDVISRLGAEIDAGGLTRREAINTCYVLLVAGFETTASQIGLGALLVMSHPEQQAALAAAGPSLADNAVEEILRYVGVSQAGRTRIALADIDHKGIHIKAGDGVIVMGHSANRDPAIFDDPDKFDIRRQNASAQVEFGVGPHICLGRPLARLELQVVFGTLFRRIPTLVPSVALEHLRFKNEAVVYGLESLPVTW